MELSYIIREYELATLLNSKMDKSVNTIYRCVKRELEHGKIRCEDGVYYMRRKPLLRRIKIAAGIKRTEDQLVVVKYFLSKLTDFDETTDTLILPPRMTTMDTGPR